MAIVTFLSDFGLSDHYVAAVKASIIKAHPQTTIVDISHQIAVGDVGHAAHILSSVFRDFPEGTVHLIAVSNSNAKMTKAVAVKLEDHYFVGDDSGIFSLLSEQQPTEAVDLHNEQSAHSTFVARDVLGAVAARLANGQAMTDMGTSVDGLNEFMPTRSKATKQQIAGNIVRIDHYGNLITNIMLRDFAAIQKINDYCPFEVNFRREKIDKINQSFFEVGPGECFVIFDSQGRLQIGVLQGNGSELLGLMVHDQVFIDFKI
ncbi:SAM-dependent chlorinase/fluorinase [Reichenbachiella agarivorans]|uniref:SAM-dependent chlorinase/fluorinase n=1 Tax=Reichenbachiella agarivorans TaxID=2979464 RepID=A0ABY6CLY2_9BACT|nr:SAM-dependent chlorinase/fluorinase [Reichenbachiella agarivorans]UXP30734.1 SAM-dependent chlorinase/fluorinase [Reichenbachiella agarivorans]